MAKVKRGYVYLLSNESMPNIYKVGYTTANPYFRASQLSSSTSCPTPFQIVCFAEFEDAYEAEKHLHDVFTDYRVNPNKEFFKFTLTDLITYACHLITAEAESNCIEGFRTDKYRYFLDLFRRDMEYI